MIGPSANGSENGTPTSMMSAPARATARINASERARSGCPAVMYVTRALRRRSASAANRWAICSDVVVADADAIAVGICHLDDRPVVHAGRVPVGEIRERAREEHVAALIADDLYDRPR